MHVMSAFTALFAGNHSVHQCTTSMTVNGGNIGIHKQNAAVVAALKGDPDISRRMSKQAHVMSRQSRRGTAN
jgi:hypothetical protein